MQRAPDFVWIVISTLVLFLGICVGKICLAQKSVRNRRKYVYYFLLAIAFSVLLNITLMGRTRMEQAHVAWRPFESYVFIFGRRDMYRLIENIVNVILFIPIGLLLPLCFEYFHKIWRTVCFLLIIIIIIEGIQFFGILGVFEIDDIIHNLIGGLLGIWLFKQVNA